MLEWVEDEYLNHYDAIGLIHFEESRLESGHHIINDERSCGDCSQHDCEFQPETLKLFNEVPIAKYDIEKLLNEVDSLHIRSIHERCDLLFADERTKLMFCELSCSAEKYIHPYWHHKNGLQPGKRAKAYHQMQSVIRELERVPSIRTRISQYPKRVCLFAYRAKTSQPTVSMVPVSVKTTIGRSLSAFTSSPLPLDKLPAKMGNGFEFQQVKYPKEYKW
jgi:hypothetical protein